MSSTDPLIGKQLGDYIIQGTIGAGGMARVYRGYDEKLDRYAAIKVIEPNLVASDYDEEYRERFLREARSIARLNHPRIVGIYQFSQLDNLYYMAMEFLEGRDLRQIIKEYNQQNERASSEEVLQIVSDIASALDYAHKNGVIHRDVKPSNIMVNEEGHAMLTDFGLALNAVEGTIGNTFGSVHYIAPEQAVSSAQAVAQSDLYSLGVVLYELLTGRVPFEDASAMSVALKHISDPPPLPSKLNPSITPEIEEVVIKILDKSPEHRFQSGQEFVAALRAAFEAGGTSFDLPVDPSPTATHTRKRVAGEELPQAVAVEEDAPTITDPSIMSRPSVGEMPQRSRMSWIIGFVIVLIIIVVAVLLLVSPPGISSEDATGTQIAFIADTETAGETATAAFIAALPTDTPTDTPTATATDTAVPTDTATSTPTASETAPPTDTATATNTPQPTDTATATSTATRTDTPTPTATPTITSTPVPRVDNFESGGDQLLLRYDGRTVVLINRDPEATIDIRSLRFVQIDAEGEEIAFDVSLWSGNRQSAFPPMLCYQAWSMSYRNLSSEDPPADVCETRLSTFQTSRTFWTSDVPGTTFEVRRGADILATCQTIVPDSFRILTCSVNVRRQR